MRKRRRVDANQAEIVEALRAHGCSVEVLSDVGRGVPDLLVGFAGRNYLVEVKKPGENMNAVQRHWHDEWNGMSHCAESASDAVNIVVRPR